MLKGSVGLCVGFHGTTSEVDKDTLILKDCSKKGNNWSEDFLLAFPSKLMVRNCVIVASHFFVKDLEGSRSFSWMLQDFHREPRLFT